MLAASQFRLWVYPLLFSVCLGAETFTLALPQQSKVVGRLHAEAEVLYQEGKAAIENNRFNEAARKFQLLSFKYPDHPYQEDVKRYLAGYLGRQSQEKTREDNKEFWKVVLVGVSVGLVIWYMMPQVNHQQSKAKSKLEEQQAKDALFAQREDSSHWAFSHPKSTYYPSRDRFGEFETHPLSFESDKPVRKVPQGAVNIDYQIASGQLTLDKQIILKAMDNYKPDSHKPPGPLFNR